MQNNTDKTDAVQDKNDGVVKVRAVKCGYKSKSSTQAMVLEKDDVELNEIIWY